jgi:S1-C subfamily serine protease
MMTMGGPEEMAEGEETQGGPRIMTRTIGGPEGEADNLAILMGSGIIARQDGDAVVVAMLMPDFKNATGGVDVKEGDRIVALQTQEMGDYKALQESFDAIGVGEEIELTVERDGKQHTVSFRKAEPAGRIMRRDTKETNE